MSDDLDDLLRRAMKTLDDEVPSGYFEALPTRTLARLEDKGSMQTTGTMNDRDPSTGVPPVTNRDEDSGLHDIRSLASSTKLKISSRRSTQSPAVNEDDILASSSAGWKAVALPEPAKMVSLPELAALPSKSEVESKDREARAKIKAELKAEKAEKKEAAVAAAPVAAVEAAPAVEAPTVGSRFAPQLEKKKSPKMAIIGIGVAAAAGAGIFFAMQGGKKESTGVAYESKAPAAAPELTAKELPAPPPTPADPPAQVAVAAPVVEEIAPPPAPVEEEKPAAKPAKADRAEKVHKVEIRDTAKPEVKPADKPVVVAKEEPKKGGDGDGEPSFDALLKEAGVSDQKKENKPVLDKKSLSGGDIKTGMSAVAGKAQACYKGTQGTAQVKLTVSPEGKVTKVSVGGSFAGTPEAACVEAAVRSASFPPWDGGPQSFGYSYLLAE